MNIHDASSLDKIEMIGETYSSRDFDKVMPSSILPEDGMPAQHAYNIINDWLMLDGNARLNLATFVTTYMEPEADKLMAQTACKNMIDKDEYPQTADIEMRCVSILAKLWHAESKDAIGCSTIGSSEACMLGGLAMKWRWRNRMKSLKKDYSKPNLIMNIGVQVCWEKFCRYWDVEMRFIPMTENRKTINAEEVTKLCDENTIGVVGIMGITYTGEYEPILELNNALLELNKEMNWDIGLHVDAASGGFIAPFLQPELLWDFRLELVRSISTSGHKYGLVYPGVGWVVWGKKEYLPKELIFNVNYLGGEMPTFALNFSRPGSQIVLQYYNFLRLGYEGYKRIQSICRDVAKYISKQVHDIGIFEVISDGSDIPVMCFKLKHEKTYNVFQISEKLRYWGWLVPAYSMPENITNINVLRIVVREGFSMELASRFVDNLKEVIAKLDNKGKDSNQPAFHH